MQPGLRARDAARRATRELQEAGVPEPGASAEILISELLGVRRGEISLYEPPLDDEQARLYEAWIERRSNREPVQRILGRAYFRNLIMLLNEKTLIPRPDTESVVGAAIEIIDSGFMAMAGQAVYRWATTRLTEALAQAMERAGVTAADIDVFAPHQANLRIIESMTKRLGFGEKTVIARDIVRSGNTSAASIPLALGALLESGEAKSGDLALVLGYGAGLTYAGQVLRLP